jgi:hypothetical protein
MAGFEALTSALLGQYAAANFNAGADGQGGSLITEPAAMSSVVQTPLVAHAAQDAPLDLIGLK